MKKRNRKRLTLNRETRRAVSDKALAQVAAAACSDAGGCTVLTTCSPGDCCGDNELRS